MRGANSLGRFPYTTLFRSLTVANAPGAWLNGLDDPMYNVYLYPFNADNITVTVTDLPPGRYDRSHDHTGGLHSHRHNAGCHVQTKRNNYGTQATTTGSEWT